MKAKKATLKAIISFKFILLLLSCSARAEEWREFYSNARALSMGNASVAVTNDETALILNPAALGRLRDFYGTLIDPEYDTSANIYNQYKNVSLGNNFDLTKVSELTDNNRETYYHNRAQGFPSYVRKFFGLGVLYKINIDAEMNSAGDSMYLNYRNDIAVVSGLSVKFFDGRIKLGANAKLISRVEIQNPAVNPLGAFDMTTLGATEGVGLSVDAGILLAAPWTWIPTIGAVLRDAGGTTFDKKTGVRGTFTNVPAKVEQTVDAAIALFPIHSNNWRSAWTIEMKDVTRARTDTNDTKRYHAGFEYNYADAFFLRAGYNQGYWTAGLELASEHFQWQFASYGEEIGDDVTSREDRRYVLKIAFRF